MSAAHAASHKKSEVSGNWGSLALGIPAMRITTYWGPFEGPVLIDPPTFTSIHPRASKPTRAGCSLQTCMIHAVLKMNWATVKELELSYGSIGIQ